jgi:hypothetical protein
VLFLVALGTAADIVLSRSSRAGVWSKPTRIPLGPRGRSTDFVLPAFAVDPRFKNRLALAFYALTSPDCSDPRCRLVAGLATSVTGGKRWHRVWTSSPMRLGWLADTSQGQMVGDYFGLTFSGGRALALVVLADAARRTVQRGALRRLDCAALTAGQPAQRRGSSRLGEHDPGEDRRAAAPTEPAEPVT